MQLGKPLLSPPETPTLVADLALSVTESIDNLEVVLQPGARIAGRVVLEGRSDVQGPHPLAGATVFVFPENWDTRDPGFRIPAVGVDETGRFQTVGLPAGKYFFNAWGSALTSVRLGGRELLGDGVELGATDVSEVVLSFTDRHWTLSGAVRDRAGQPAPDASVIVFPRDRNQWQMVGFSTAVDQLVTDRAGVFQASGALAGDYLVAIAAAPPEFWMAPEYLETLVPLATPVRLELDAKQVLQLRLQ
jgi:hypothetical protein